MYPYELRQRGEKFTIILQKALKKYKGVTVLREGVTSLSSEYDVRVKVDPQVLTKFSGSTIVGKICYEVHKGPKGGYFIWKQSTRGPHKGNYYKKYVTGSSFTRSDEKDPTILEALEKIIARVCKTSWEYKTEYEWSDENSEFWIGLINNEYNIEDPDPEDLPSDEEGEGPGDGFGDGDDGDFGEGEGEGEGPGDDDGEGPGDEDGEGPGDDDGEGPDDEDGEGPGDDDDDEDGEGEGFGDGDDEKEDEEEKICPNCEAPLELDEDDAIYCPDCGWKPEVLGHCPHCGEELVRENGLVMCPECEWTEEDDDGEILCCPRCGDDVIELMGRKECKSCDWCEEDEENLCPECGEVLEEDDDGELYCPECGWCEHEEERCPECNTKLKEGRGGHLYCPECGWNEDD